MPDNKEYTLSLILKILTEGTKDILGIKKGIEGVDKTAAKKIPDPTERMRKGLQATNNVASELKQTIGGLFSAAALSTFVRNSVQAARQAEASFKGLEGVAEAAGVGIGRAFEQARLLASDGLLTVAEASRSLQNLLSRGYDIEQAVQTLNRLKDAAAFNRQASLALGEAVVSATEGLKNENSILVDNAGVTKNVSVLWKEYADQIGKTTQALTQNEKIQAEVNGILRETEAQAGNAAKALEGLEGSFARLRQAQNQLNVAVGTSLNPTLTTLANAGTRVIDGFVKPFIGGLEIAAIETAFAFQSIGASVEEQEVLYRVFRQQIDKVVAKYERDLAPAVRESTEATKEQIEAERALLTAAELNAARISAIKAGVTDVIKAELAEQIAAEAAANDRIAVLQQQRAETAKSFQDLITQLETAAAAPRQDVGVLDIVRAIQAAQAALEQGDLQKALDNAERARDVIGELAAEGAATNQYLTQQARRAAELADRAGAGLEDAERANIEATRAEIKKLLGEADALKALQVGFDLAFVRNSVDEVVELIRSTLANLAIPVRVVPTLPEGTDVSAEELLKNLPARAGGGLLRGVGTPTSDSNLYWGSRGEFVQPYKSVRRYGVDFMEAVRRGLLDTRAARALLSAPRFAEGGLVAMDRLASGSGPAAGASGTPVILQLNGREYALSAPADTAEELTRAVKLEALRRGKRA